MKLGLSTPKGVSLVLEDVKAILVHFDSGEFQVLENHIPLIAATSSGYLKIENHETKFVALNRAIFEFSNNHARIIASNAVLGNTLEEATTGLENLKKALVKKNLQDEEKFILLEKQIREGILKSRAGNL